MSKPVTRKMAVDCILDRINRGEVYTLDTSEVYETGAFPVMALVCSICGKPLLPSQQIQFDHIHSDAMGGPHEYRNLRPIHYDPCHKQKSKRDVAALAKVDRITGKTKKRRKAKIKSRGFQKGHRPMRGK